MGQTPVPFPPRDQILAIVPTQAVRDTQLVKRIDRALTKVKRTLLSDRALKKLGYGAAPSPGGRTGAIRLVNSRAKPRSSALAKMRSQLDAELGKTAWVGTPIDLRPGRIKVVGNEFVVRFRQRVSTAAAEALIESVGATIVRVMVQAPKTYLIRFDTGAPMNHLETIEQWHQRDLLVYGEPNLAAEITDDAFPYSAPDDPTYPNQLNLTLQRFDDSWRELANIDPKVTSGSPRVYIASLDRGIDIDHPDLGGTLTDGATQMSTCFDFSGMRACSVAGYQPNTSHGMGVYGIIAAATNNADDIAGIASNTHHIGLERPGLTSTRYADVLLWAAGFVTNNITAGWPNEPLSPAADIISCSHGQNGLALSGIMDDTLTMLAEDGRRGLGTVVVYSAGNSSTSITGFRTWAAHPSTIAVSNSQQPNAAGVETLDGTSNFGPEIDVCAQGTGAPSLNRTGGEQTFGGTSAAAPTGRRPRRPDAECRARPDRRSGPRDLARNRCPDRHGQHRSRRPVVQRLQSVVRLRAHRRGGGRDPSDFAPRRPRHRFRRRQYRRDPGVQPVGHRHRRVPQRWRYVGVDGRQRDAHRRLAAQHQRQPLRPHGGLRRRLCRRATGHEPLGRRRAQPLRLRLQCDRDQAKRDAFRRVVAQHCGQPFRPGRRLLTATISRSFWSRVRGASACSRWPARRSPNQLIHRNGTRFGGWLRNIADNRFGPVGDFDGDGNQEIMVSSPWGIGVLKLLGSTFANPLIRRNGSRFTGWLLNTADNRFGPVGDFDGDGRDEIVVVKALFMTVWRPSTRSAENSCGIRQG